jgi:FKBP-type peptidyl-prolyl cis-trans isomerase
MPRFHLLISLLVFSLLVLMSACSENKPAQTLQLHKAAGEAFLRENGQRPGVVTLSSGLQYEILRESTGPTPLLSDNITVHYHGTHIDGTVFDSSVERNKPLTAPVNAMVPGWQEALQRMPLGAKWKIYVPPHLAYGEKGVSGRIPPHSVLVFELELLNFAE